jgi:hypothetical protein
MKSLIIVESFTKTKTIKKYINDDSYSVTFSGGHIYNLPKDTLGFDTDTWKIEYIKTNPKIISNIREQVRKADIQLYIRLVYCYFSNYSLDKLQKQVKQVNMNKRTSIKNDIMIVIALVLAMRCLNGTKRFWIGNNFLNNYPCASDHEILAKADVLAPDILLKNIVKVSGPSG